MVIVVLLKNKVFSIVKHLFFWNFGKLSEISCQQRNELWRYNQHYFDDLN